MRVIMFDRQSIFIHGAISRLQELIPEINLSGTSQTDELWALLSASPTSIVMIDGRFIQDDGMAMLEEIMLRFPALRVVMVLAKHDARWVEQLMQSNVTAIIPRNAHPEMISAMLESVSKGMVCFPGDWLKQPSRPQQELSSLSERQREVLKLLAAGETNKEISRTLNISTGTVKAHLEALFRRLDVKNRTQAALFYTRTA
ncbi:response regulator transcription factor [Enterobacter soli]|uniref:response regulator transcription factor n=1 Tax=Enterobacter TaxID=547 RepID=UPI001C25834C|nr:response regulator transcription factor [Enterobacter soli]MCR1315646.1 response regulator transcription factor [Enterobacter soli]MDD9246788.1 response regulator transcription factor [Enterobacter soli]HDR2472339.1 response regulator transcription factor [Enterobacter soli]HED3855838.1 response regulator transcription factor [Enterobacter soli]